MVYDLTATHTPEELAAQQRQMNIGRYAFQWAAATVEDWWSILSAMDDAINSKTPWSNAAVLMLFYGLQAGEIMQRLTIDQTDLAAYVTDAYMAIGALFPKGFHGYHGQ